MNLGLNYLTFATELEAKFLKCKHKIKVDGNQLLCGVRLASYFYGITVEAKSRKVCPKQSPDGQPMKESIVISNCQLHMSHTYDATNQINNHNLWSWRLHFYTISSFLKLLSRFSALWSKGAPNKRRKNHSDCGESLSETLFEYWKMEEVSYITWHYFQ